MWHLPLMSDRHRPLSMHKTGLLVFPRFISLLVFFSSATINFTWYKICNAVLRSSLALIHYVNPSASAVGSTLILCCNFIPIPHRFSLAWCNGLLPRLPRPPLISFPYFQCRSQRDANTPNHALCSSELSSGFTFCSEGKTQQWSMRIYKKVYLLLTSKCNILHLGHSNA